MRHNPELKNWVLLWAQSRLVVRFLNWVSVRPSFALLSWIVILMTVDYPKSVSIWNSFDCWVPKIMFSCSTYAWLILHESSYLGGRLKLITEFSMVTWSKLNIPFDSLLFNDSKNFSKSLLFGSASPSISDSSSWMVFPSHDNGSLLFHLHAFGRTKVSTPCKSFQSSSILGINELLVSSTAR